VDDQTQRSQILAGLALSEVVTGRWCQKAATSWGALIRGYFFGAYFMNTHQAVAELRQLTPAAHYKVMPPDEWEKRQKLISMVEEFRQSPSYIKERNAFIPKAEAYANATTMLRIIDPGYAAEWNRIYLARMNTLMALERERVA
jgi:hypothetical protein